MRREEQQRMPAGKQRKMLEKDLQESIEPACRKFTASQNPTMDENRILGIRVPVLRKYAQRLRKEGRTAAFLKELPHAWHEEDLVHAFLLSREKYMEQCLQDVKCFLPYVDSWDVCDSIRPAVFEKNNPLLRKNIAEWLKSDHPWTMRFGVEMLMAYCLDEHYRKSDLKKVCRMHSDDYYAQMMQGWYLAEAMVNHYEDVVQVLDLCDAKVRKTAIRKARESYRISEEKKQELTKL